MERIPIWEKGVDARYVLCLMQCIWDAVGTWNMHLAEKSMEGIKKMPFDILIALSRLNLEDRN